MPNKGLRALIRAMHDIPKARLLVVGDGPMRNEAEELTRELGMADRVTFLGWVPSLESVAGAIQTASIFVMNSMSEGGPRSALEAMACGMPVIATPVGIMPFVIKNGVNGFFTTGEPADLTKKISMLLADEALRERVGREASKILDRFEKTALVKEYADFLKSLA
jgi:glycosyltransferase involved in cell wall biosynthesis